MTLVLAVTADDGVALASDCGVSLGGMLLPPTQKVFTCDGCAAWGAAGDIWVIQRVQYALAVQDTVSGGWVSQAVDAEDLRQRVLAVVHPVLAECMAEQFGNTSGRDVRILFAAVVTGGPCMIQINGDGTSGLVPTYGAVGSGTWAAVAIMRHFTGMHPAIKQAAVVAVQAVQHAIDCVPELTSPVHLAIVRWTDEGTAEAQIVPEAEVNEYSAAAATWRNMQSMVLKYITDPSALPPPPNEPPAAPGSIVPSDDPA